MNEIEPITQLANVVRLSPSKTTIFTISTNLLSLLLQTFDKYADDLNTTTFHTRSYTQISCNHNGNSSNNKAQILSDLLLLRNYIEQIKTVKLYYDNYLDDTRLDLIRFKQLIALELHKVDVNRLRGLQKLRTQLNKLICYRTLNNLSDILIQCGGDRSDHFYWNELKEISFINNEIKQIDNSFECVPFLHTLDLSHNLIKDIEILNNLINLKHLNLSYNKLERLPQFKGQICSRLQQLILKNNFIDDINGIQTLTNLCVLDLSNNCLIDHKSLLSISHLVTLQWLNLSENPLCYHPLHRIKTCSYLHINTVSINFILDNGNLTKSEKRVVGSLYPKPVKNTQHSLTESLNSSIDKVRKVRHVHIEDDTLPPKSEQTSQSTATSSQYLETKKQIENLRKQYGDSWLRLDSGVEVQNVLGLEQSTSLPISSSPYDVDFLIHSQDYRPGDQTHQSETSYVTALETTINETDHQTYHNDENNSDDDGDVDLDGEESIYLATPKGEDEQIFLIITKTHLLEKECSTSKERNRWHIKSIKECKILVENQQMLRIDFETMRRDRQQRIYIFDDDIDKFFNCIQSTIEQRLPEKTHIDYQCMKCSRQFAMLKKGSVLQDVNTLKCPHCDSTLVVET